LVIARVVIKEVIGNRSAPLVNLHAHSYFIAVLLDAVVIIIKKIRLDEFKAERYFAAAEGLLDETNKDFTGLKDRGDAEALDVIPAQLAAGVTTLG
jgi:hypothetical protein